MNTEKKSLSNAENTEGRKDQEKESAGQKYYEQNCEHKIGGTKVTRPGRKTQEKKELKSKARKQRQGNLAAEKRREKIWQQMSL